MQHDEEYDITAAFKKIEDELIASMIRNMDRHRAEEDDEGILWTQWQTEQLKALEKYKVQNQNKYRKQFKSLNKRIEELISIAHETGNMEQEIEILEAIKNGFEGYKKSSSTMQAEFFKLNERKLEALIQATTADMEKAETAILRMANDKYRKAIFNAQVYANTGAGTYEKAVDMATKEMLDAGLNCVEYANGARHTLADYVDMAIRTASKRAYLQGEGQKRQEWGIATVIINKRGNPCPKCLPFCGKVLVDDVWSGGNKEGAKYPLMSYAISKGLYHPRCRDSHTTYFPGISTADDKWTKEELEAIGIRSKQEAEQQYAKRQAEKFERLELYSLDDNNRKLYKNRAAEWRSREKNYANSTDIFVYDESDIHMGEQITPESIFDNLQTSEIGRETIEYIEQSGVKPRLVFKPQFFTHRGEQQGNIIKIYIANIKNPRVAAQTIIHEITHHKYDIGGCQWAEAVCFAKEKMHIMDRTYLTANEKRYIINLVKQAYPELQWKKGGYKNGKRF